YWGNFVDVAPIGVWISVVLVVAGSRQRPWFAALLMAVVVPHQLVPYKVWRFVHPALWLWMVLAAVGWRSVVAGLKPTVKALLLAALLLGCAASWMGEGIWKTTWLHHQGGSDAVSLSRALNRAYLHVGTLERPSLVVQAALPQAGAPGAALMGHDVVVRHPMGRRLNPETMKGADLWILREVDGRKPFPTWPRLWRDSKTGLVVVGRPK
ncbi:MAG TPA: hypothetical protein DCQ06_04985, partial [Myxococcales bacterium]|nr:hypothetical protein [Myxococcales bacterium]